MTKVPETYTLTRYIYERVGGAGGSSGTGKYTVYECQYTDFRGLPAKKTEVETNLTLAQAKAKVEELRRG